MGVRLPLRPPLFGYEMNEKYVEITLDLDEDTYAVLQKMSEERNITINDMIIVLLEQEMHIDNNEF